MRVAADLRIAKRRVDDFLWRWREDVAPLRDLRRFFRDELSEFEGAAIIGGLVRDLTLSGKRAFKSDIDLVIAASQDEVLRFARRLAAEPNRFGGFSFQHPRWKIDFWALENTWAAKQGLVPVHSFADLLRCTFFDCDAIYYDLVNRKVIAAEGYLDRINQGRLEVNLLQTPSRDGNLLRAIRRLLLWNMHAGPVLRAFIIENLDTESFDRISRTEVRVFNNPILGMFSDANSLKRELFESDRVSHFQLRSDQMQLPGVFPS